jgi:hypothetical protein
VDRVEAPRLALADLCLAPAGGPAKPDLACFAYERHGLSFSWEPDSPLRSGRFRFSGFGRVLTGARAGMIHPVSADLRVTALGAAHSPVARRSGLVAAFPGSRMSSRSLAGVPAAGVENPIRRARRARSLWGYATGIGGPSSC